MEGLNTERTWVFTTSLVLKESHLHLQLRNSCTVVTAPHALYRDSGSLESQLSCKRQEKRYKGIQLGKEEVKVSLFTDNNNLYIKSYVLYKRAPRTKWL